MKSLSASAIAAMVNGKILGDENKVCTGVASVKDANCDTISFVGSKKYQHQLETTTAGIILVNKDLEKEPLLPESGNFPAANLNRAKQRHRRCSGNCAKNWRSK